MTQTSARLVRSPLVALVIAGCQSAARTVEVPPPPPPTPSTAIHIVPAFGTLPFASTVQFQALTSEGNPVAVRWRLDDPVVGTISQDGLLTTSVCAESRPALIEAILLADTTKAVQLHTFGARTGPTMMGIDSITNVPGGGANESRFGSGCGCRTCVSESEPEMPTGAPHPARRRSGRDHDGSRFALDRSGGDGSHARNDHLGYQDRSQQSLRSTRDGVCFRLFNGHRDKFCLLAGTQPVAGIGWLLPHQRSLLRIRGGWLLPPCVGRPVSRGFIDI